MTRWPAEWEPHFGTILVWPTSREVWGEWLDGAREAIRHAVRAIAAGERVWLIAPPESGVGKMGFETVECVAIAVDDIWTRDSAPTFVDADGSLLGVDWNFGAWGGKFPHERDAQLARHICRQLGIARSVANIVLEGGALETNGNGRLICTRTVALDPNRNPGIDEQRAGEEIRRCTGATEVIWLERGMAADDTDGHVDTLARFVDRDTVLFQRMPAVDRDVEAENAAVLQAAGLSLIELPCPNLPGRPASYANFYWSNACVLVPMFGVPEDGEALATIDRVVDRPVVPIDCRALVTQGGAIHCATQQVPRLRDR